MLKSCYTPSYRIFKLFSTVNNNYSLKGCIPEKSPEALLQEGFNQKSCIKIFQDHPSIGITVSCKALPSVRDEE